jgi:hydrogenase nickel incorporation protein HypA/HybF
MHELSIAQSLFEAVEEKAAECQATIVKGVHLKIGEASGVQTGALSFCFAMLASQNPVTSGAQLWIEQVPHRARCRPCRQEFSVENFITQCPNCQQWDTEVISGTELQIVDLEIETAEAETKAQPCLK